MAIDLHLPLDTLPQVRIGEIDDSDTESELDLPWAENIVTATGAAFTVLFVSSVAVVMYLA
jgi:hypothetical protein